MATSGVLMGDRLHGASKNTGVMESFQTLFYRRLSWNWLIRTLVIYSIGLHTVHYMAMAVHSIAALADGTVWVDSLKNTIT